MVTAFTVALVTDEIDAEKTDYVLSMGTHEDPEEAFAIALDQYHERAADLMIRGLKAQKELPDAS